MFNPKALCSCKGGWEMLSEICLIVCLVVSWKSVNNSLSLSHLVIGKDKLLAAVEILNVVSIPPG